MKNFRLPLIAAVLAGFPVMGQPSPAEEASPQTVPAAATLTAEQLEQLLGPIALYPDALIALILPAATVPTDIVLAARQLRDAPDDRSQIEHRGWDESVKSLTSYPEVLQWLDENLPWTKQVGEAFLEQPAEVMEAIQRLRNRARAAGTLIDTPQQQIIAESNVIRIVPAQPDIIYVPRYEPEVVFYPQPIYSRPLLTFGIGVGVGSWLAYDCDWHRKTLWHTSRHRPWVRHDWSRPVVPISRSFTHVPPPGVRLWRPSAPLPPRPSSYARYTPRTVVRPTLFGSSSGRSYQQRTYGVAPGSPSPSGRSFNRAPGSPSFSRRGASDNPQADPVTGIAPVPSAASRAYARSNLPGLGARAPSTTLTPNAPTLVQPSTRSVTPPNATHPGQRRGGAEGIRDKIGRPGVTYDRSTAPRSSLPRPQMGPMPEAPSAPNPTLSQPAAASPARSFRRAAPAPAVAPALTPTAPATEQSTPPNRVLSQPGAPSRSGGETSNRGASSGRSWNRGNQR